MTEEMKINPCPKCGNASVWKFAPGYKSRSDEFRVQCGECGKKGAQRLTKETAVKAWNEGKKR